MHKLFPVVVGLFLMGCSKPPETQQNSSTTTTQTSTEVQSQPGSTGGGTNVTVVTTPGQAPPPANTSVEVSTTTAPGSPSTPAATDSSPMATTSTPASAAGGEQLTQCKSNLKNLATACEMYSTDFRGLYPDNLDKLRPSYLKEEIKCPTGANYSYESAQQPDRFTMVCQGQHEGLEASYPQYTAEVGLIEKP